jgi:hypothetical protein
MQAPLPRYARERPSGDFCQVQTGGTGERISQWGWINMKHRHMIEGDYPYIHIYIRLYKYIYIYTYIIIIYIYVCVCMQGVTPKKIKQDFYLYFGGILGIMMPRL